MAAWTGGPCPECGDEMPANMLRCMTCRAWLNPELRRPEPAVPEFRPLPEIEAGGGGDAGGIRSAAPEGHFVVCPACRRELRVGHQYAGRQVACRFCDNRFPMTFGKGETRRLGVYVRCWSCGDELRAAAKYLGREVICKHCDSRMRIAED